MVLLLASNEAEMQFKKFERRDRDMEEKIKALLLIISSYFVAIAWFGFL